MKKILTILFNSLIVSCYAQWQGTSPVYFNSGFVGIGTSSPLGYLHVNPNRPIIIRNNGGSGVYGSEIGFNAILNTGVVPNRFKKLGGTSQEGGANMSVDYRGNIFFQMTDAPNENEYEIDYKPQIAFLNTGKVGIGTVSPSANLQIGAGTENGLLNLGGYATVGSLRSSGDFFAGMNTYTEYSSGQNFNIKVLNTNAYGFSTMQLGYTGEISFFSKAGSVSANDVANTPANLKMKIMGNGFIGIGITSPNYPLDMKGDLNLDDGGVNSDLRVRLHQKAALASYNTQSAGGNTTLYVNRDWDSGVSYHSDFNFVSIYGNVGVGVETPTQKLQVDGSILIPLASATDNLSPGVIAIGNDDFLYAGHYLNNYGIGFHNYNDGNGVAGTNAYLSGYYGVDFFTGGVAALRINRNGNVGIGTTTPTQKLTVKGTVYSTEVKVDINAGSGPDYVFEKDYALPSLESVKTYIDQNKHLPEVPSAKEMEANGINLSEMNMLLLKKVEELTLHLIQQESRIEKQQKEIDELKGKKIK